MPPTSAANVLQERRMNVPQMTPTTLVKVAALTAANQRRRALDGVHGTPTRHVSGVLGNAPLVVESQRYEEWMKIATDNKITSTNTWNLALIDYFHDMSLLRNGDGDNSINFQKASCTLDGCVKIWTSRVDSVATETGKLLSGLAEDGRAGAQAQDVDEDDDNDDDDEAREKKAKKKTRQAATLADSFSKIKLKSLDLEFSVDPLFAKTSADFDEGGAGGILMNHLGCDGNMKVVFDAGDAKLEASDEDEDEQDADEVDEIGMRVDLNQLRARCLPEGLAAVHNMSLCPSFASFRFSADAHLDLDILNPVDEELPVPRKPVNVNDAEPAIVWGNGNADTDGNDDFFAGREFGGGGDDADAEVVDFFADDLPVSGGGTMGVGPIENLDPRRATSDRELVMASIEGGGEDMFGYFDNALGKKNWAGPEHWKMRRVAALNGKKDDAAGTIAKQRKEKVAFSLDFDLDPPIPQDELFAPAQPATIRVPRKTSLGITAATKRKRGSAKSVTATREESFQLPDDFHFNSQMLLRLFLKPKTILKMRRRGPALTGADGEVDAQYWADQGAAGPDPYDYEGMGAFDDHFNQNDGYAVPFDTQILNHDDDDDVPYFNDDEDEPGLDALSGATPDDAAGVAAGLEGDLSDDILKDTQGQLKRVRPENINYAKRAKRVDVKKLKDSIWKELEDVTIVVEELPSAPSYTPGKGEDNDDEDDQWTLPLVPVVNGLRKAYPKDKMDEISTSFCFICLLHLANEKGLRLQTPTIEDEVVSGNDGEEEEEGLKMRKNVGGLEGLKVFREVAQAA